MLWSPKNQTRMIQPAEKLTEGAWLNSERRALIGPNFLAKFDSFIGSKAQQLINQSIKRQNLHNIKNMKYSRIFTSYVNIYRISADYENTVSKMWRTLVPASGNWKTKVFFSGESNCCHQLNIFASRTRNSLMHWGFCMRNTFWDSVVDSMCRSRCVVSEREPRGTTENNSVRR